jgi:hypothetical protein
MPLSFEPNLTRASQKPEFVSRGQGYSLRLRSTGVEFVLLSSKGGVSTLGLGLIGANPLAAPVGTEQSGAVSNYFIGNDSAKWRTNIPNFGRVKYNGVYPGIDLAFYGNQRQIEYDFVVAPGADPTNIHLQLTGANYVQIDRDGHLVVHTRSGELKLLRPVAYQQDSDGERHEVSGAFVLSKKNRVSFRVGQYDKNRTLVIDPVVNYSTFLGGSGNEMGAINGTTASEMSGIAVDNNGAIYVTGLTFSNDFPLANAFQSSNPGQVAFVSKFDPTGATLLFSTYLGGTLGSNPDGIAVDANGFVYVAGSTISNNFPTTPGAFQSSAPGPNSSFVTKLSPTGNSLVFSTYVGGSGVTSAAAMALDGSGHVFITGAVSGSLPVTPGAFQMTQVSGAQTAFVAELAANGASLVYCTYLGGSVTDIGRGIALDSLGNAYVAGFTDSPDFPTKNAYQGNLSGAYNAFVTELNPTGTALVYSTYLGGSGLDQAYAIAVDSAGSAYVTGSTSSSDFPTVNALQPAKNGPKDAFVTKVQPNGSALVYSTYLGGNSTDQGLGIAVDSAGDAYVTGQASFASGFPTKYPLVPLSIGQSGGAFVTVYDPAGGSYVYSTLFGGVNGSGVSGTAITTDSSGNAYVVGFTSASDMPVTPGAFQTSLHGFSDAFVLKLAPLSFPATSLTFGSVTVGTTSSPMNANLINSGFSAISIQQVSIGGANASDFAQTTGGTCGSSLAAQSSCTIAFTFSPATTGVRSATASIATSAGPTPQIIALAGTGLPSTGPQAVLTPGSAAFGNQAVGTTSGTQVVVLSNPGSSTLNISNIALTGPNASAFGLTSGCGTTLAAGNSCNLSVNFSPNSTGPFSGAVTVTDDASNSPQSASLSGTGTPASTPQAVVTPNSLSFGNQIVGTASIYQTMTLSNPGNATLSISNINLTGANSSSFGLGGNCGTTLSAGASCSISVTFVPATAGPLAASLIVSDNASGSPQTAALSGTGVSPQAVLSPSTLSFGNQTTGGSSAAQVLTLSNPGTAALNITGIALGGANSSAFATTSNCGSTLAAGASCSISMTFAPTAAGSFTATLSVADNAGSSPQAAALSGTGVPPVPPTPPDFTIASPTAPQTTSAGGSAQFTIDLGSINGAFNSPVTLSAAGLPPGATAMFNPSSGTPGSAGTTTMLTIQLPATVGKLEHNGPLPRLPIGPTASVAFAFGMVMLGGSSSSRRQKRRKAGSFLATLLLLAVGLTGCGGSGYAGTKSPTPYGITVTGTSGSTQHSITLTLTVQ